ncbi:MAG: DUF6252 family protein [Flavobacteriaceae bacterium]
MKKAIILNWMLFALLALSFSSCTNETLEGQFITDDGNGQNNGVFTCLVDGANFEATSISATLTDGFLAIKAIDANGNSVLLGVTDVGLCTYDLSLITNSANYLLVNQNSNPFSSFSGSGGSGVAEILNFDPDLLSVSGTFQFIGIRQGTAGFETVTITNGSFSDVTFELISGDATLNDCDTGGGGGNVDPDANFFANIDGEEFIDETIEVIRTVVFETPMINIKATAANGAQMRIDIPENIGGTGTYEFPPADMPISNGTLLFASYNDAMTGESYTSIPTTGTITFTEFGAQTGKLTATFSFSAQDPISGGTILEITDGTFTVDYIENSGGVENTFSADIDGETYTHDSLEITQSPFNGQTIVTITTIDSVSNRSVTISFPIDIEAGMYEMAPFLDLGDEKVGIVNPNIGSSILFKSNPGILYINSYEQSSGIIEGEFSFSAVDPLGNDPTVYEVTNGAFVVSIQ